MAIFFLVRHGSNDWLGKGLAGRLPEVHLNAKGQAEAEAVSGILARKGIQRLISSPLERARETAAPLASRLGLTVEISEEVLEVHFGDWNGRTLDELDKTDGWNYWNSFRSGTRIPNGETILEIQARMVRALERFRREQPEAVTAVFSHGDPIRATLVYYLGMPLDFLTRIEISPGSYSMLRVEDWGAEVLCVNRLPE